MYLYREDFARVCVTEQLEQCINARLNSIERGGGGKDVEPDDTAGLEKLIL